MTEIEQIFVVLLNMSISASVTAGILLMARLLLRRFVPATFCYLLWGIVFARLALPVFPSAASSLFNLIRPPASRREGSCFVAMDFVSAPPDYSCALPPASRSVLSLLGLVWLAGVAFILLRAIVSMAQMRDSLCFAVRVSECAVLEECRATVGLRQRVELYRLAGLDGPVEVGVVHPRIYLPPGALYEDEDLLRHILVHELTHIRRFDALFKMGFLAACAVHWFNPVVWLCLRLLNRDLEASCDEIALAALGEEARVHYAETLLRVGALNGRRHEAIELAFGETALRMRVRAAISFRRTSPAQAVALGALFLALGMAVSTNPVSASFVPRRAAVGPKAAAAFQAAASSLGDALAQNDSQAFLDLCENGDPFFLPLYRRSQKQAARVGVEGYRLYPQSDTLCYCYLETASGRGGWVAVLIRGTDGETRLNALESQESFSARMTCADSPQAEYVRRLHRFGLVDGFGNADALPRPAVAAFLIENEYERRIDEGMSEAQAREIPSGDIRRAAHESFGLAGFSYTFDDRLFDAARDVYRYEPGRGESVPSDVIKVEQIRDGVLVTAQIYRDPLHSTVDKIVTYTVCLREDT